MYQLLSTAAIFLKFKPLKIPDSSIVMGLVNNISQTIGNALQVVPNTGSFPAVSQDTNTTTFPGSYNHRETRL